MEINLEIEREGRGINREAPTPCKGLAREAQMGSAAVEKTEEELRKEIEELHRQQWEVHHPFIPHL